MSVDDLIADALGDQMQKLKPRLPKGVTSVYGQIMDLPNDVLYLIFLRLPAKSLAFVDCSCLLFHQICELIFKQPKLLSTVSSKVHLESAVNDAFRRLLSHPIRPHLVLIYSSEYDHTNFIANMLCWKKVPVVCCSSEGMVAFKDADGKTSAEDIARLEGRYDHAFANGINRCEDEYTDVKFAESNIYWCNISVTIGFFPGLVIHAITMPSLSIGDICAGMNCLSVTGFLDRVYSFIAADNLPLLMLIFSKWFDSLRATLQHLMSRYNFQIPCIGMECAYVSSSGVRSSGNVLYDGGLVNTICLIFEKDNRKIQEVDYSFHLAMKSSLCPLSENVSISNVRDMRARNFKDLIDEDVYDHLSEQYKDIVLALESCEIGFTWLSYTVEGESINLQEGGRFQFYTPNPVEQLHALDLLFQWLNGYVKGNVPSLGVSSFGHETSLSCKGCADSSIFGSLFFMNKCFFDYLMEEEIDNEETKSSKWLFAPTLAGAVSCGEIVHTHMGAFHSVIHVFSAVFLLMSYKFHKVE